MARDKLGRNEPCWCGSNKKFKKCHLGRATESPIPRWETDQAMRSAFEQKKCLAPSQWLTDCKGQIVKAHTVPRSVSLNRIAREGHVYSFIPFSLEKFTEDDGLLMPRSRGVKNASTFTGFCKHHDEKLFSSLEKITFTGTAEQCFLLMYRALSKELYAKDASSSLDEFRFKMDRGLSPLNQKFYQHLASNFSVGVGIGLRDISRYKRELDEMLVRNDYKNVRAYILDFDDPPPVMCSATFFPEQDYDGKQLQDIGDLSKTLDMLTVTSFFGGEQGHIAFVWLDSRSKACSAFTNSLSRHSDTEVTNALVRLFFEYFENIHLKPEWWEGLEEAKQLSLSKRMTESANPYVERPQRILADDGIDIPPWPIVKRRWIT